MSVERSLANVSFPHKFPCVSRRRYLPSTAAAVYCVAWGGVGGPNQFYTQLHILSECFGLIICYTTTLHLADRYYNLLIVYMGFHVSQ